LKRAFAALPGWPWKKNRAATDEESGSGHLTLARESLRDLIDDSRLPPGVRESLAHDYDAVEAMLDKLEHGHLHLAVFGRVSTGKSSLLNALVGEERFAVSPLHGATKSSSMQPWAGAGRGGRRRARSACERSGRPI
jgi:predicted GTPase